MVQLELGSSSVPEPQKCSASDTSTDTWKTNYVCYDGSLIHSNKIAYRLLSCLKEREES